MRVNEYILKEIERIYNEREFDKPVIVRGTIRQRKILYRLESARIDLMRERERITKQFEYTTVSVAGIIHDIKTPMALIAGCAECLQDGVGDKDYLKLILETIEKLQGIVDSVSLPKSFNAREDVDVKEFVSGRPYFYAEFNRYREMVEERGVNYVIGRLPAITQWFCRNSATVGMYVNKKLIDRVVQNIITNNLRYTPRGGTIRIIFSKGRQYFYIKITDTGSGIKSGDLPFIFDRGFRSDTGGSDNKGLGLYMAKDIIVRHGGEISVKSKEGKGTAFTIKLPIVPIVK